MTKYNSAEVQSLLLDLYAMHGTDTSVARLSGVSRVTLWRMSKASEDGEPSLQECDWAGVIKPYHEHKLDALDLHVEDVMQRVTRDAAQGQFIPVVYGGMPQWRDCEFAHSLTAAQFKEYLEMSDEDRDFYGVPKVFEDRKMRGLNSRTGIYERVQVETYLPPTLDSQAKVLSAFAPETFGDRRRVDLNVTGGLGVTVIGQNRPPPQVVVDVTPAITNQVEDGEFQEPFDLSEPTEEPAVLAQPEPFTPDPNSPLTEEQQKIMARARSGNGLVAELAQRALQKEAERATAATTASAPRPEQPPPPSTIRDSDQDDTIPRSPRGMKVC